MYIIISFIVCLVDLISKKHINNSCEVNKKTEIYPDKVFIWNTKNKGIAYNNLEEKPWLVKLITSAITLVFGVVFIVWIIPSSLSRLAKLGAAFIFGGALGNLTDRLKNDEVTDFIYLKSDKLKNLPIVNFADLFIFAGTALMAIFSIKK